MTYRLEATLDNGHEVAEVVVGHPASNPLDLMVMFSASNDPAFVGDLADLSTARVVRLFVADGLHRAETVATYDREDGTWLYAGAEWNLVAS